MSRPLEKFVLVTALTLFAASFNHASPQASLPEAILHYADMVLYNGKILTADERFTVVQAVATRDGKFLAVGTNDEVLPLAGPRTQRIDLQGRCVVPGLIDTHLHQAHVGNSATETGRKRLKMTTVEEALDEIREELKGFEPGQWLIVGGPRTEPFYKLDRLQLDSVSPRNPVVIINMNEECLANSLALKESGIPTDMVGYIRDPKTGEPTGHLARWAAGAMIYEKLPWPPLTEEQLQKQKDYLTHFHAKGMTTLGGRVRGFSMSIYNALQRRGELTMRIRVAPEIFRLNGNTEGMLKRLGNLVEFGNEMFKIIGATVEPVDGTSGDAAALSWKPKLRRPSGDVFSDFGQNMWTNFGPTKLESPRELTEWRNIQLAARYGWNVTSMHSQGDQASAILLDAYQDAHRTQPIHEMRFGIDHGLMQTPENLKQIKELGVIPSIAAKYLFSKPDGLIFMYGQDRVHEMTPVKSLIKLGIKPVAEADILQEPYSDPLWNIEKFITRTDEKGRIWSPDERISRQEALYMYTLWAARYHWDEKILGSIEAGKLADLAVLDRDYMTVPENEIAKIPIYLTVVGGKIVYRQGDVLPSLRLRGGSPENPDVM